MIKPGEVNEIKILNSMESILTLMLDNYPTDKRVRKLWKKAISLTRKARKKQFDIVNRYINYGIKKNRFSPVLKKGNT